MPPPLLLKFQLKISTKLFVLVITVDNESNITIIVSVIDLLILTPYKILCPCRAIISYIYKYQNDLKKYKIYFTIWKIRFNCFNNTTYDKIK